MGIGVIGLGAFWSSSLGFLAVLRERVLGARVQAGGGLGFGVGVRIERTFENIDPVTKVPFSESHK